MNFGCWGTGLGHDKAIRRSADRVQNQAVLRAGTVNHGTVKYYAQIHLQVWQNSVCTGQGNLPLIT